MVERPSISFHNFFYQKTDKILVVRLGGVVLGKEQSATLRLSLDFGT